MRIETLRIPPRTQRSNAGWTPGEVGGVTQLVDAEFWELGQTASTKVADCNRELRANWLRGIGSKQAPRRWLGGIGSMTEAHELIRDGWQSGGERALALSKRLEERELPEPVSVLRTPQWRDEGDDFSYDRLLAGHTDQMFRVSRRASRFGPRTIAIGTEFGGHCHRSADELFWNGAAAIALTDIIEQAGYVAEVTGFSTVTHGGGRSVLAFRAKRAGEILRPDSLAAVLCHAGIFRIYGILALECFPMPVSCSHGSCVASQTVVQALESVGELDRQEIWLGQAYNEDSALAALRAALQYLVDHPDGIA